jgi:hypothetical protein
MMILTRHCKKMCVNISRYVLKKQLITSITSVKRLWLHKQHIIWSNEEHNPFTNEYLTLHRRKIEGQSPAFSVSINEQFSAFFVSNIRGGRVQYQKNICHKMSFILLIRECQTKLFPTLSDNALCYLNMCKLRCISLLFKS